MNSFFISPVFVCILRRNAALAGKLMLIFPSRLLAVLAYLVAWVSALFIFLLNKNRFVRFHCLQAMLFFFTSHLLSLITMICMGAILVNHANKLLSLAELALPIFLLLLNLFTFIVWLVGMVQAWRGNYYQLPFVGALCEKIIVPQGAQAPSPSPER